MSEQKPALTMVDPQREAPVGIRELNWRFKWYEGNCILQDSALYAEWADRVSRAPYAKIFDEPLMIRLWAETIGRARGNDCRFCVAESDRGHIAQLPFFVVPSRILNFMTRRMFAVGEPHFDYQGPLVVGELSNGDSIWRTLGNELENRGFCEEATVMRISNSTPDNNCIEDVAKVSPVIQFGDFGSWDDYLSSRPQKHRTDIRRQRRRLAEAGPVSLKVFRREQRSEAAAELRQLRNAFEELWAGTASARLFEAPGTWDFYERMVSDLLPTGMLHFSVLQVGNVSVAWHFGFLHRGVLHYYKPTYRKAWSVHSPGKVLLSMLVQLGFESGWNEFDFGCGDEPYKLQWTDTLRPLYRWHWTSTSLRRRLGDSARRFIRNFLNSNKTSKLELEN